MRRTEALAHLAAGLAGLIVNGRMQVDTPLVIFDQASDGSVQRHAVKPGEVYDFETRPPGTRPSDPATMVTFDVMLWLNEKPQ